MIWVLVFALLFTPSVPLMRTASLVQCMSDDDCDDRGGCVVSRIRARPPFEACDHSSNCVTHDNGFCSTQDKYKGACGMQGCDYAVPHSHCKYVMESYCSPLTRGP